MADLLFADADLAALYDPPNASRGDFTFYMPVILAAPSMLDVGCGTGSMLREARNAGRFAFETQNPHAREGWPCNRVPIR